MNLPAKSRLRLREAWVIFFFLGLVMLNYPFLHIFNKDVQLFGIPLLILYLLIGWPLSIGIVYLFSLLHGIDGNSAPPSSQPKDEA
jgi:predicted Kef-type K+ transport protein